MPIVLDHRFGYLVNRYNVIEGLLAFRRGPDTLPDDAHSYARCHLKNVIYAALFSGLACFLTASDGEHVGGLPANHVGPAAGKYDRLCSVDVAWTKHVFHEVSVVHHPPGETGTAGYYGAERGPDMLDAPTPSVTPNDDVTH